MRHAIVRNAIVENVVEWDGETDWQPPAGTEAVECANDVAIGWTHADGQFAAPAVPPPTLDQARAGKQLEIDAAFDTAVAEGMPWQGKVLQIDDASRANISGQATRALGVLMGANQLVWPQDFAWRMADNSWLPVTAEEMLDMAQAASDRYVALRLVLAAKKDAVAAAADVAAVEAIDADNGWD